MKKIRLLDGTEIEIHAISEAADILQVSILNADASQMENVFSDEENLSIIQYYVGTDLLHGYARYTALTGYEKKMDQLIAVDYSKPDPDTESGFTEERAAVLTVFLNKTKDTGMDAIKAMQEAQGQEIRDIKESVSAIETAIIGGEADGETDQ